MVKRVELEPGGEGPAAERAELAVATSGISDAIVRAIECASEPERARSGEESDVASD
jgi:hypothetical protein